MQIATGSDGMSAERCKYGYKINGCELGYPGCVCSDEAMYEELRCGRCGHIHLTKPCVAVLP